MLSIILPAFKEQYLPQTIDSLLENAVGEIEIIAVLDSYWPDKPLKADPRVHIIHVGEMHSMRGAINAGMALAKGDFVMKTDAHCMFAKGYDKALTEEFEDNWVVIPRMYKLNPEKWEIIQEDGFIDYMKLLILGEPRMKFHGQDWISRRKERLNVLLDETMAFQGSCWVMKKTWWLNVVGPLQEEGYGPFCQEPTEIGMKTWEAGGKMMINKKTWYAHKHRDWNRTHHVTREEQDTGNTYALEKWKPLYEKMRLHFGV